MQWTQQKADQLRNQHHCFLATLPIIICDLGLCASLLCACFQNNRIKRKSDLSRLPEAFRNTAWIVFVSGSKAALIGVTFPWKGTSHSRVFAFALIPLPTDPPW